MTNEHIQALRAATSPQAHSGGIGTPRLFIEWCARPNPLSALKAPGLVISDWSGYLTATADPALAAELAHLEAEGGAGTVRDLLGMGPKAIRCPVAPEGDLSIDDLIALGAL
jgi:hypothetical protein